MIKKKNKIHAVLSGESIYSNKENAFDLFEKSRFGEKKGEKIIYSFSEALYLVESNRMEVIGSRKNIDFDSLIKKLKRKDKRIEIKYSVFRDLRAKGYIVKTALKFGAEFRVYGRGKKPGQEHALWILYPVRETETLTWHDFSAKTRVAHSTKKKLLVGVVDEEGDVTYYEIEWARP